MTERLIVAAIAVAGLLLVGVAIRYVVGQRSARRAAFIRIAPSSGDIVRVMLFSTPRCGDCKTQRRLIDNARATFLRRVEITHHDMRDEGEFARRFGIVAVPALVVAAPDGSISAVRHVLVEPDRLRSLIAMAG